MELATLKLGNLIIGEPMTSLTDILLAVTSFVLVARIRNCLNESFFNNAWRMFFLCMGISTSIGTIAHAINGSSAQQLFNILWMAMTFASSTAVFYAVHATIRFMRSSGQWRKIFMAINVIALIVFLLYTAAFNNFEIFKIHAAVGVVIIFLTHTIAWLRNHHGSGWVAVGMGLSILTVVIHSMQLSISKWFNYKDISHVIMLVSLICIYNGIHAMSDNLQLSVFRSRIKESDNNFNGAERAL
ncbi:MAG TPA: hypothetical protein PK511_03440 [Chitinophagales bacterium]|nr:hypothetical protein [Chitinophagales bacterium]HNA57720.1 hypothetical protein [Chitinophagales bacterium]HNI53550.1 hypothetical protein [Chitinophagales bacterium]HNM08887.1 hypothetical protein [Chitinophagales bacterium]HNM29186.1 hypothetical protein [Chitinophagales bacterium]